MPCCASASWVCVAWPTHPGHTPCHLYVHSRYVHTHPSITATPCHLYIHSRYVPTHPSIPATRHAICMYIRVTYTLTHPSLPHAMPSVYIHSHYIHTRPPRAAGRLGRDAAQLPPHVQGRLGAHLIGAALGLGVAHCGVLRSHHHGQLCAGRYPPLNPETLSTCAAQLSGVWAMSSVSSELVPRGRWAGPEVLKGPGSCAGKPLPPKHTVSNVLLWENAACNTAV